MNKSRIASLLLLAAVPAGMLFAMEEAVRQWMPQQLVRHYNIPDPYKHMDARAEFFSSLLARIIHGGRMI